MTLSINLNNNYKNNLFVKSAITQEVDKKKIDSKVSNSLSKDGINHLSNTLPSQIKLSLGKETLLSLQELQESTSELLSPQKAEIVTLQKETELDDTPRLSWLIGRDDNTYNWFKERIPYSIKKMDVFAQIVELNKDNQFISYKDTTLLQGYIKGFQGGYDLQQKARASTSDPIVHKVLDYTMPKTQARLQLIKDYLESKELDPVEVAEATERKVRIDSLFNRIDFLFSDKKIEEKPDMTLDISQYKITHLTNLKSHDITEKLLEFLAKDSKWYEWYLRDDALEPFESLQLT